MTIIVNLFGAPSSGKSTTRAGIFHELKLLQVNCEEVYEYAKNLTWEQRFRTLECQPYVFGKQLYRIETLMDQVDVIITDSPVLLSAFYGRKLTGSRYSLHLWSAIEDTFYNLGGINYFIDRVKPYNPIGRNQSEEESDRISHEIMNYLDELHFTYTRVPGDENAAKIIATDIKFLVDKYGKTTIHPRWFHPSQLIGDEKVVQRM